MIYKFKSPASGDVIMLGPQGDEMLRVLGRAQAAKGIIETADMPAAIAALQAAVASAEAPRHPARSDNSVNNAVDNVVDNSDDKPTPVGLRQRLWPMVEMLRRAHAAGEPVVWGV